MKKRGVRAIQREIDDLHSHWSLCQDKRVRDLISKIRDENEPKVAALRAELEAVKEAKPKKKPRWPEDIPDHILKICKKYWEGTDESYKFRIHCWNDHFVWTSYASGGYSDNGGWHPTPACFILLNFDEIKDTSRGWRSNVEEISGRVSLKKMKERMDYWTEQLEK
jgi:hypothetical protein